MEVGSEVSIPQLERWLVLYDVKSSAEEVGKVAEVVDAEKVQQGTVAACKQWLQERENSPPLWKPKNWTALVNAAEALQSLESQSITKLKEEADKAFNELCESLDKVVAHGIAYVTETREGIVSEIKEMKDIQKSSSSGARGSPGSSQAENSSDKQKPLARELFPWKYPEPPLILALEEEKGHLEKLKEGLLGEPKLQKWKKDLAGLCEAIQKYDDSKNWEELKSKIEELKEQISVAEEEASKVKGEAIKGLNG